MSNYEPPLTEIGSPCIPGQEGFIATGVRGYAVEHEGKIFIPLIIAEKEGSGDVGSFLDSLSQRCVIPNVTSDRLLDMLQRRGFCSVLTEEGEYWEKGAIEWKTCLETG